MQTTQSEKILAHFKEHGELTSFTACMDLGIVAFTTRISELRRAGWDIVGRKVKQQNRDGKEIVYNAYAMGSLFNTITGEAI